MGPKKFLGFKELFRLYEACVLNIDLLLYPETFEMFAVVVVGVESDFRFLLWAKPEVLGSKLNNIFTFSTQALSLKVEFDT